MHAIVSVVSACASMSVRRRAMRTGALWMPTHTSSHALTRKPGAATML